MTIDRRTIFTLAWKRAKAQAAWFPNLRAAFSAALRSVWALAKASIEFEAAKPRPVANPAGWRQENVYRASAVHHRITRLGTYCGAAGW